MNNRKPPSSICFYSENHAQHQDDCSGITEPQVAAYRCHDRHDLSSSRRGGLPFMTSEQREIFKLKQQVAKQQEMINFLSSKLSQCQLEKEELVAQNSVLIEERTEQQLPADAHFAKLMRENARLQVVSNVMRKSFKKSSQDARRKSESDKQTIKTLAKENKNLRNEALRFSQVNVNQGNIQFESCGKSAKEGNMLEPQPERQQSRKLSTRETELSKSNRTAPTYLTSECDHTLCADEKNDSQIDNPKQDLNVEDNGNGTINEDSGIKDIDAEELKELLPWMKWAESAHTRQKLLRLSLGAHSWGHK